MAYYSWNEFQNVDDDDDEKPTILKFFQWSDKSNKLEGKQPKTQTQHLEAI